MAARDRLLVEIERDSEPISGLVRRLGTSRPPGQQQAARRFSGYMELIAALEDETPAATNDPDNPHNEES